MADLLADENFPRPVVVELRRLGHDVVESSDLGLARIRTPDDSILAAARAAGRAVLTFDRRDYVMLHRASPEHAGIVACTYDPDFVRLAARINAALAGIEDLAGQVIRVVRPGPAGV